MVKVGLVFSLLFIIMGCGGLGMHLPEPDSTEAKVYKRVCSQCHSLPHPKRNIYKDWVFIVALMEKNMKERFGGVPPKEEMEQILSYLKRHGK